MTVFKTPDSPSNRSSLPKGAQSELSRRPSSTKILKITNRFLEIANRHSSMKPLLESFTNEIQSISRCEAVGIRLLDPKGNIPYEAHVGFVDGFLELANNLSIQKDQCACVDVIVGTRKPDLLPYYTQKGSFFVNGANRSSSSAPSTGRKARHKVCPAFGYETLCLIPIYLGDEILGLIHLADHRDDILAPGAVAVFEQVAMQLSGAIVRVRNEDELRGYRKNLETMVQERTAQLRQLNEKLLREADERNRLAASLKISNARYDTLFQAARFAIFVHIPTSQGRPGRFVEVNDTACEMLDYTREELVTLSPSDIIDPSLAKTTPDEAMHLLLKSTELSVESAFRRKNGSTIQVEINTHRTELDGVPMILSLAKDITERKRLEQEVKKSQDKLKLMLEQMPCILWTMDKDLRYTSAAGLGLKLSGRKPEDLVGRTIFEYSARFTEHSPLVIAYRKALAGQSATCEQKSTLKERFFLVYMEPMFDDGTNVSGIVGVSVDITDRKRMEVNLRSKEKRLSELVKAYVHAQDDERQWLSLEIHDRIVQPMSAIYQLLQAITPQMEPYPQIAEGVNRALAIGDEVIKETRVVMKELFPATLSRYGLAKLVEEELGRYEIETGSITATEISHGFDCPKILETTLYRVFHEALLNVRKHGSASEVRVSLVREGNEVILTVTDNGIGFDPQQARKVIGGLVCMRRRTELMDGTFEIRSQSGKGTTVISRLPIPDQEGPQ